MPPACIFHSMFIIDLASLMPLYISDRVTRRLRRQPRAMGIRRELCPRKHQDCGVEPGVRSSHPWINWNKPAAIQQVGRGRKRWQQGHVHLLGGGTTPAAVADGLALSLTSGVGRVICEHNLTSLSQQLFQRWGGTNVSSPVLCIPIATGIGSGLQCARFC